jgi:hypothetical protein
LTGYHRHCINELQGSLHHTTAKEARSGSDKCEVIPPDIQFVGGIQAAGVAVRLMSVGLMLSLPSAYCANYSTETVVLRLLTDILQALDHGDLAALTLLDLSAAYDTVDHAALRRLDVVTYGVCVSALSWFASYLSDHMHCVRWESTACH